MVEELSPKIICDKAAVAWTECSGIVGSSVYGKIVGGQVITHWNLSPEVHDPANMIKPVQDADEVVENDTAATSQHLILSPKADAMMSSSAKCAVVGSHEEAVIRTKGEKESTDYTLAEQEDATASKWNFAGLGPACSLVFRQPGALPGDLLPLLGALRRNPAGSRVRQQEFFCRTAEDLTHQWVCDSTVEL